MKKFMTYIVIVCCIVLLSGCSSSKDTQKNQLATDLGNEANHDALLDYSDLSETEELTPTEKIAADAEKEVENTISKLENAWENIEKEIDTYDKYKSNMKKVNAIYEGTLKEMRLLGIRLREYSVLYAEAILNTDDTYKNKYDDLKSINRNIYDGAVKDMYDIYDNVLDDAYDVFYDGVVDDAYDDLDYDEWVDVHSDAYDQWVDTRSDAYDIYVETRSDVYEFVVDLRSEVYSQNDDGIEKVIKSYKKDILKMKEDE